MTVSVGTGGDTSIYTLSRGARAGSVSSLTGKDRSPDLHCQTTLGTRRTGPSTFCTVAAGARHSGPTPSGGPRITKAPASPPSCPCGPPTSGRPGEPSTATRATTRPSSPTCTRSPTEGQTQGGPRRSCTTINFARKRSTRDSPRTPISQSIPFTTSIRPRHSTFCGTYLAVSLCAKTEGRVEVRVV